jgi:hypothetical protein
MNARAAVVHKKRLGWFFESQRFRRGADHVGGLCGLVVTTFRKQVVVVNPIKPHHAAWWSSNKQVPFEAVLALTHIAAPTPRDANNGLGSGRHFKDEV